MKLAVLFLCAGLTAPIVPVEGQNADGIRTDSVRVVASGASVGIRFRMEVPRSCIRSNYTLRYTPVLFGGGREEKLLPIAFTGAANVSRTGASRSSMAWLSPPSWKVMPGRSSMRRAYPMRGGCPRGRWGSPSTAVSKAIRAAGSWTDSNFWRISASGIRGRSTLRLWPWPIRRLWSGAGF